MLGKLYKQTICKQKTASKVIVHLKARGVVTQI